MDHLPRFLDELLPLGRDLTAADLGALLDDPFWNYELRDGSLVAGSPDRVLARDDLNGFPEYPLWTLELFRGVLVATRNSPGERHQDCVLSLYMLLRQGCPPQLKAMAAPYEFSPDVTTSVQPDVLVARRPIGPDFLREPPLLAAEVLSPSSRWRDTVRKRALYQELGIEHYWIVDPAGPSILRLELVDGTYCERDSAGPGDQFRVSDPVSLSFDPAILID